LGRDREIWNLTPAKANGAGTTGYFTIDSFALTDSLSVGVNVGTGNLLVSATDAWVPVVGGTRPVGRTYNSASLAPGASAPSSPVLGPGWRFTESPDHRLVSRDDGSVTYVSPTGATPCAHQLGALMEEGEVSR